MDALRRLLGLRDRPARRIVGLISGTSCDAIEAVVLEVSGVSETTRAKLLSHVSQPLDGTLQRRLRDLAARPGAEVCELHAEVGERFGEAALATIAAAGLGRADVDLIGAHGQTAHHRARGGGRRGATLQIGDPARIAEVTGLPVVADFRARDVAAGGQGAPLVPLCDWLLFRHQHEVRALQNLGGIGNVTVVTPDRDQVFAFDTGPANMPLDTVARAASGGRQRYDADGALARAGRVDAALLDELLAMPYFALPPPRSTGRDLFGDDFTAPLLTRFAGRLADLQATLVELAAVSIARALDRFVRPRHPLAALYLSGGGVENGALVEAIRRAVAPLPVQTLESLGWTSASKEAVAFALLANQTLFGEAGNLPAATGAPRGLVLGTITLP
jgi:anhydro-N-acetylmuramic acid kinase